MKTKFTIALLMLFGLMQAQRNAVNFVFDKSAHIGAEIERIEKNWYAKAQLEYAPKIDGGYMVIGTAVGYSKTFGMFDNFRLYTAPKIQFIRRGGNTYPSFGAELGLDRKSSTGLIVGLRGTYDYRTDFDFWGGKSEFRPSVFIKVGFEF